MKLIIEYKDDDGDGSLLQMLESIQLNLENDVPVNMGCHTIINVSIEGNNES